MNNHIFKCAGLPERPCTVQFSLGIAYVPQLHHFPALLNRTELVKNARCDDCARLAEQRFGERMLRLVDAFVLLEAKSSRREREEREPGRTRVASIVRSNRNADNRAHIRSAEAEIEETLRRAFLGERNRNAISRAVGVNP